MVRVFVAVFAYMAVLIGILALIGLCAWAVNRYADERDRRKADEEDSDV